VAGTDAQERQHLAQGIGAVIGVARYGVVGILHDGYAAELFDTLESHQQSAMNLVRL
jgi:hypothetical protein